MSTDYQQFGATEQGMKKNEKMKTICASFSIGALSSALIVWGIMSLTSKDTGVSTICPSSDIVQPTADQSNALTDIRNVFFNSTWNNSLMCDEEKDTVNDAFDTFDEDGDGELSYDEFKTFKIMLNNHSSMFNKMDVDDDSIVTIREFTAHLLNMHGVAKYILIQRFENLVYDLYGLDERNVTVKSQAFHEYVSDIYYQNFDVYGKGCFNLTDFQDIFCNNTFRRFDENNDDMISFEEFIEGLYHQKTINSPSSGFQLFRNSVNGQQMYKDKNGKTQKAKLYILNDYDHNDVAAINFTHICPLTEYNSKTIGSPRRRRLSCVESGVSCGLSGAEAGMDCTEAVGQDGLDPVSDVECGSSAVEAGSDCYDAYNDCFGSDSSSSTSTGSDSYYSGGGYYGGGYY